MWLGRIDSCVISRMDTTFDHPNCNFDYIGFHYYSLTWSCYEGQALFTQRDRVDLVRAQFLRASRETEVVNIAYCFMPDHVHQLVKGISVDADAKAFICKAKQYSGFYFKAAFQRRLWFRKGFNRVLIEDREVRAAVKYIIENPVKAGLVTRVENYPYTGSETHTLAEVMELAYAI
jgi:REP element-mobilizing transposase RayT